MKYKRRWFLLVLLSFLFSQQSLSQLDPFYFGTYVDKKEQSGFFIYTMDEVVEDCFLVEYLRLENGSTLEHISGFGHCHGPNGHMEIKLTDRPELLEVWFDTLPTGEKTLTCFNPTFEPKIFFGLQERIDQDVIPEGKNSAEKHYITKDHRSLIIHTSAFEDEWSFILHAPGCDKGGVIGAMVPYRLPDGSVSANRYVSKLTQSCTMYFILRSESVEVEEIDCDETIKANCPKWAGTYTME